MTRPADPTPTRAFFAGPSAKIRVVCSILGLDPDRYVRPGSRTARVEVHPDMKLPPFALAAAMRFFEG